MERKKILAAIADELDEWFGDEMKGGERLALAETLVQRLEREGEFYDDE